MSDPEVQALAIMGYLAKFQKTASRETGGSKKNERVYVRGVDLNNVHVNKAVSFLIFIYSLDGIAYYSRAQLN